MSSIEFHSVEVQRLEPLIKKRMAYLQKIGIRADSHHADEYVELARMLRKTLQAKGRESRIKVLDYPLREEGRVYNEIDGVEGDGIKTIAYNEGRR
jgi:hypothetical protein